MSDEERRPPLITAESPSYERARHEHQHPAPVGDAQVVALFAKLSEAEHNASIACTDALQKLEDESLATRLRAEVATHGARRVFLGGLIAKLGGSEPRPDECRTILTAGVDAVAYAESEQDALNALKVMRKELRAVYAEVRDSGFLDEAQRASLAMIAPKRAR